MMMDSNSWSVCISSDVELNFWSMSPERMAFAIRISLSTVHGLTGRLF